MKQRTIRAFRPEDGDAVAEVWRRSGRAAYPFLDLWREMDARKANAVFREVIAPRCDIWVGSAGERVQAFLAMRASYIDRMYVLPDQWRQGWGGLLLTFAKQRSPEGLELHTHQENTLARSFYEKHGFRAVRFGTSPPPESAPDVEYWWRPEGEGDR